MFGISSPLDVITFHLNSALSYKVVRIYFQTIRFNKKLENPKGNTIKQLDTGQCLVLDEGDAEVMLNIL